MNSKNVCVVVLGDIGRSPRMQYHALSLAEHGHMVDVVCYRETPPMPDLQIQPLVNFHYLAPYPNLPLPRILNYVFKTFWQAINMLFVLLLINKADILLMQNPPAIPSMFICWIYTALVRAKFLIDWHNYAFSIMALNHGMSHFFVRFTKYTEKMIGQKATQNFCVTKSMKADLKNNWNIDAITLYDRPPNIFKPISLEDKHAILTEIGEKYPQLLEGDGTIISNKNETGNIVLKSSRMGIIISSTSWTEDEDFSILLSALQNYENHYLNGNTRNLPKLMCIITGKGPLKAYYTDRIKKLKFQYIQIITPWLETDQYPKLLATADLGVCLHTSSSGLDLPMKVVDMFGCALPVCAYDFACISELVQHNDNSFTFKTSDELSKLLLDWFDHFPNNSTHNDLEAKFKAKLHNFQSIRWSDNWNSIASPLF